MHEVRRNFLVGLFVLLGLLAAATLAVLLGRQTALGTPANAYVINIRFPSAYGIREGTRVLLGGIEVGRALGVDFVDPDRVELGVTVRAVFDEGRRIRAGTRAQATEPGLGMGYPPVILEPGPPDAPWLASGASIEGGVSGAMDSLIPPELTNTIEKAARQIGTASEALQPVLVDMHEILQKRSPESVDQPGGAQGNLSSAMARLDESLKHVNTVMGDEGTQSKLREAVENLHQMTADGKVLAADLRTAAADARTLIAQLQTTAQRTDEQIAAVARSLTTDLELAAQFLTQLNEIAERANRGEGTLGKLVTDEALYEAMTLTFRRLAETVEEFRLLAKEWQQGKIKVSL
jgi:phospholipid/cholesterol/gamma-HCH transport system substrate-binding protein